ncbi:MAG: hypothetical protein Q8K85_12785, partial [Hyphomicrobium sp.]|nr:hypothetical protein [Hyphomicrobium sp.]
NKKPALQARYGFLALAVFVFRPAGTGGARNLTSNRRDAANSTAPRPHLSTAGFSRIRPLTRQQDLALYWRLPQ